jgi:hypothetical protein
MSAIPKLTQADFEAIEKERSRRDAEYFIEEYVYIEDRDSIDNIATKFSLWDGQKRTLQKFFINKLIQILKARQLGLTWLALAYACWSLVFKSGFSVIALSKTEDDAKELTRRLIFILDHLPAWMVPKYEALTESVTIFYESKEPSTFQSFPASKNSGRSFTANLIILDEWAFQQWAREIWKSAYPTINRPTGGQVIGLSTIERGTLFEEIWLDKDNGFEKIFLPWNTDPRRNQEWYESTKRAMKDAVMSEYPATEEEAFAIPGGAFFSEFRTTIHLKAPEIIPTWYVRYRFMDYGLDMLACYFVYINNQGDARIYKEIYESGLVISEAAYRILQASGAKVPEEVEKWNILTVKEKQNIALTSIEKFSQTFAPPDLFSKSNHTGRSGADVWADNGIYLTESNNDFEVGCLAVSEWLHPIKLRDEQTAEEYYTAKLTIDQESAPNLVRSLLNIQRDANKPKVYAKEPHGLTHSPDALRYLVTEMIQLSNEPKDDKHPGWYAKLEKYRKEQEAKKNAQKKFMKS